VADAQVAATGRCWKALAHRPRWRPGRCSRWCWAWRPTWHRQGLHADDGRGRHPAAAAEAASIGLARSLEIDLAVQRDPCPRAGGAPVIARAGSDELGLDPMGLNETDLFMQLARARTGAAGQAWLAARSGR
jgi:hypothetical protein